MIILFIQWAIIFEIGSKSHQESQSSDGKLYNLNKTQNNYRSVTNMRIMANIVGKAGINFWWRIYILSATPANKFNQRWFYMWSFLYLKLDDIAYSWTLKFISQEEVDQFKHGSSLTANIMDFCLCEWQVRVYLLKRTYGFILYLLHWIQNRYKT